MIVARRTIAAPVEFEGRGLHSGEPVRVRVHPGESGLAFVTGAGRTPATPENVTDTTRSTKVGDVGTVEHLLSALAGMGVTDAEIEVDGPEMPGLDGSSAVYVAEFARVGFEPLPERELPDLYRRLFLQEEGVKIAIAKGDGHWRYEYVLDGGRWPGRQEFETNDVLADYPESVAPARTFALAEEVAWALQHGLGMGLDDTSCVVVGIEGYKNAPRFPDELARHKLLDLLGDLALAGVPAASLSVVAERSGHRTNVRAAAMLREAVWGAGL